MSRYQLWEKLKKTLSDFPNHARMIPLLESMQNCPTPPTCFHIEQWIEVIELIKQQMPKLNTYKRQQHVTPFVQYVASDMLDEDGAMQ